MYEMLGELPIASIVQVSIEFLTNRTEPSAKPQFTPPGCRLCTRSGDPHSGKPIDLLLAAGRPGRGRLAIVGVAGEPPGTEIDLRGPRSVAVGIGLRAGHLAEHDGVAGPVGDRRDRRARERIDHAQHRLLTLPGVRGQIEVPVKERAGDPGVAGVGTCQFPWLGIPGK